MDVLNQWDKESELRARKERERKNRAQKQALQAHINPVLHSYQTIRVLY